MDTKKLKKIEELKKEIPLKDDVFMLFARHKDFCEEFLRVLLQDDKLEVIDNSIQKTLPSAFSKKVRLDMLCKLKDGKYVNVEVQLTNEEAHAKRIFLYASELKHYLTEKGTKYKDVDDIIEIYLTKEDIFKKGSTVYQVKMEVETDNNEFVEDWEPGLKVYYINTEGLTNKTINEYLKLLTDKTTLSKDYKVTSDIKKGLYEKGGYGMSTAMMEMLDEERALGMAEEKKRSISMVVNSYKNGLINENQAAGILGITVNEFTKKVKEV